MINLSLADIRNNVHVNDTFCYFSTLVVVWHASSAFIASPLSGSVRRPAWNYWYIVIRLKEMKHRADMSNEQSKE